jgi:predicted glycoside hydrolase/deacetylase ChbG (UPF0249 family)
MVSLNITIKEKNKKFHKAVVEFDAEKFEKLADLLGVFDFNPDFLASVGRAEKDYKAGRVTEFKSLKDLRK